MKASTRILLPFNFTEGCVAALRYAYQFAAKVSADITLLHCTGAQQLTPTFKTHLLLRLRSCAERYVSTYVTGTGTDPVIDYMLSEGDLRENLKSATDQMGASILISPAEYLLQTLREGEVISLPELVSCPALLVPERALFGPVREMVFTLDVSDTEASVMATVQQLAQRFNAHLSLLHLHSKLDGVSFCQVQKASLKLQQELTYGNCTITCLEEEDLLEGLNEFAAPLNPDLFVMATRDTHLLNQYFSGRYRKTSAYHLHTPLLNLYQARRTPCSSGCVHCNNNGKEPQRLAAEAIA
ncbi:MAG: hypothetical protein ACO1OQ_06520 [Rufibacter sp.]